MLQEDVPVDGWHRSLLVTRPFRFTVIVVGLLLAVSVGARLGGSAQEGATPGASPAASPAASPVAASAGETGTVTIRVLGCEAGTSADSVGPATCTALSVDVEVEIAGGTGDALTVEDALRLSAGVFRWQRLPHDTYSIKLTSLPDGYTSALAAGDAATAPEEIGDDGYELTLDSAESSPTITVYLIP